MMRRVLFFLGLFGVTAVAPVVHADTDPSARSEVRLDPQSIGVPGWGLVFDGGTKEQRLTGRGALHVGPMTFDLSLSGANQSASSGRSALFDTAARGSGGSVSAGVTWTNFTIRDYTQVLDQLKSELCPAQKTLNDKKAEEAVKTAPTDDDAYKKALKARDDRALEESRAIAVALAAQARATTADTEAKKAQTAYEALAKEAAELTAKAVAAPADQRNDLIAKAQAASINAQLAANTASRTLALSLSAASAAAVEDHRLLDASAAKNAAQDVLEKEEARIRARFAAPCSSSKLDPTLEARIRWPFSPTYLVRLQVGVEEKSLDYFDTADGTKKSDVAHPWNVSLSGGVFVTPTTLLGAGLSYKRAWGAGDAVSVCKNQLVGGLTTSPVTYACENLALGAPAWKQTSTIRVELRKYLVSILSTNPSFSYAWSGKETGLFAPTQGLWQFEIPVYAQLPAEKAGTTAFVLGTAFSHKQTWGLGDKNQTSDGFSVFLGGAFDIGKL